MIAFIKSIDIKNPVGELIYNYGVLQFNEGFIYGTLFGFLCSSSIYILLKK